MTTHWEKLKATQRMQDHVEEHLMEPITLTDLARCARYSPWYSARIFKECTGKAPFDYIRMRRLSEAALRLTEASDRVIDVALDFVFDSHDGFTRAFSRQFGLTPQRYRQLRPNLDLFYPTPAREYYVAQQKGLIPMSPCLPVKPVFVQVFDRPERKLLLKRGKSAKHYFEYCEEVGCEIWEILGNVEAALQEPMGFWLPEAMRPSGTSWYVQGVEVPADYGGPIPAGLDCVELPACQVMVFQGPPFEDKEFESAVSSLWDCINSYHPERYGFAWDDAIAPRFQLAPMGYRGYIEGRAVRSVEQNAERLWSPKKA